MTKKNLAVFLAMAVFLAAMTVVSGGCSGGGGGGNKVTGIPLAFDTDKDGIPDVFDDRPEVSSEYALATTVKSKIAGSGFDGSVYGEGAPLSVPRTFEGSILEPLESIDTVSGDNGEQIDVVSRDTDVDIFAVNLEAGKQYSIVFYDPNDMGGRAVEFTPSVWVTPLSALREEKVSGNDSDDSGNVIPVEYEVPMRDRVASDKSLPLSVQVAAPENIGAVILTFKTEEGGLHYLSVANADAEQSKALPYRFDIFEDENGDGMLNLFSSSDGSYSFNYTLRDLLYLESVLAKYVAASNDLGFPTEFLVDGITETEADGDSCTVLPPLKTAWDEALEQVNSYHNKAAGSKTSLDPYIAGIRWRSDVNGRVVHREGNSYDAVFGWPARKYAAAIEQFTLPRDKVAPKDSTTTYLITTKEEHERAIGAKIGATFGPGKDAPSISSQYSENVKYSTTSTTLVLNYDREETEYRLLPVKDYKMTAEAKEYLKKNGPGKFREEYGDYFIAGAKFGANFFGTVSVRAKTAEKIREVQVACSNIPIKSGKISAEFAEKFRNATSETKVVIKKVTIGGFNAAPGDAAGETTDLYWNGSGWGTEEYEIEGGTDAAENAVDQLIKDMDTFIDNTKKPDFLMAKRYVYMMRFNQIPDGKDIPADIDINPEYFVEMRKLSRELLGLITKNSVIQEIDAEDMQPGRDPREEYRKKFAEFSDRFEASLSEMVKDISAVKKQLAVIAEMDKNFQDFLDRYYFFTKLRSWWPFNSGTGERGYRTWTISSVVNGDIDRGKDKEWYWYHKEDWGSGRHEKSPSWTLPADRRTCYLKVESHCSHDRSWDDNYPSLTRRVAKFHFLGGWNRYVCWEIWGSRFNDTAYPFNWKYN